MQSSERWKCNAFFFVWSSRSNSQTQTNSFFLSCIWHWHTLINSPLGAGGPPADLLTVTVYLQCFINSLFYVCGVSGSDKRQAYLVKKLVFKFVRLLWFLIIVWTIVKLYRKFYIECIGINMNKVKVPWFYSVPCGVSFLVGEFAVNFYNILKSDFR